MVFDRLTGYILPYAVAFILSIILCGVYLYSSHDVGDKRKFSFMLISLSLVVTMVISIVHNSLALSLGLVGALSIVRFRTPIRDPEQLLFLFMAIAIGIGAGAGAIEITVVSAVCIYLAIIAYSSVFRRRRSTGHVTEGILARVTVPDGEATGTVNRLFEGIDSQASWTMKNVGVHDNQRVMTLLFNRSTMKTVDHILTGLAAKLRDENVTMEFEFWDVGE